MPAMHVYTLQTPFDAQRVSTQSWPQAPLPLSPTLTNPDMLLPSTIPSSVSSSGASRGRPTSPNRLRTHGEQSTVGARPARANQDRMGLMSRKMMLLRSRTATPPASPDPASFIASSPTLQDVGNLAPEQPDTAHLRSPLDRRPSPSGSSSSDLSALNGFLAKYTKAGGVSDDDGYDTETSASHKPDGTVIFENEMEEHRRIQEAEEHNSAVLSKRAEQILANAKKRLNVMEGNLRGARDLVAPLTAANLKRATSLGSAQHSPAYTRQLAGVKNDYGDYGQTPQRRLQAQASSPTMGRDYTGHARGFSETSLPDRPHSSLDRLQNVAPRRRTSIRAAEPSWIQGLRGTRSHESLGGGGHNSPLHARASPDSYPLEPLAEADEYKKAASNRDSQESDDVGVNNGLGIYERPSSRTSDLREQMTSLRGKISTLKERAREESLRRQSLQQMRTTSPFNNAVTAAPEFFYTSSSAYGSPVLDTNAGIGYTRNDESPATPQSAHQLWEHEAPNRNAFAQQAAQQHLGDTAVSRLQSPDSESGPRPSTATKDAPHRKTASGTAIIQSAATRQSHHLPQSSTYQDATGTFGEEHSRLDATTPPSGSDTLVSSSLPPDGSQLAYTDYEQSDDGLSIYEDAESDHSPGVVAHEDREDAFDYEHFFLHSAMGSYQSSRRGSDSSATSVTSASTARGPQALPVSYYAEDEDDEYRDREEFSEDYSMFPPATPKTPERLREIERTLHGRTFSSESIRTVDTFATAQEGPPSPFLGFRPASRSSRHGSRSSTAIQQVVHRDSGSERADSGVGMGRRSTGSDGKREPPPSLKPKASITNGAPLDTPPMSPQMVQDPVAIAVHALLNPQGKQLGLRNNAVLFGVVESLRRVVHGLQDGDEALCERLERARSALDGLNAN